MDSHLPQKRLSDGFLDRIRWPKKPEILPRLGLKHNSDEADLWGRKTVLTFDGGGVRGYASLLILKAIMTRIQAIERSGNGRVECSGSYPWSTPKNAEANGHASRTECLDNFLPCHYFDYIAGTSTGGLSAIMLGRLRMSVDEALQEYTHFGNEVFANPRLFHVSSIFWYPRSKFSSQRTQDTFKALICNKLYTGHPDEDDAARQKRMRSATNEPLKSPEGQTQTIVFSHQISKEAGVEKTHIWRTYEPRALQRSESWGPLNLEDNSSVPIWEVACATSAAPRYFNSIMIKGHEHVDGGVDANNPSLHTLKEIHYHHQNHVPELFVSIGTGRKHDDAKPSTIGPRISFEEMRIFTKKMKERMSAIGTLISIGRHGVRELTEKERSNKNWRDHCNALKLERRYRLDIGGSLSKIPLDEWLPRKSGEETLDKMKSEITQFLGQADTREQIESIAQRLVEIRRQRAETERWEVFAMNLEYACPGKNCQKQRPYSTRNGLRQHLLEFSVHPEMRDLRRVELERCLDQARRGVKDGQLKYAGTMSRKFTGDDP